MGTEYTGEKEKQVSLTEAYLRVRNWLEAQEGQGLVEYGLIIALVAVALVGALTLLKNDITAVFTSIGGSLT